MDQLTILSPEVDSFFRNERFGGTSSMGIIRATLRYIAIKSAEKRGEDIEAAKVIPFYYNRVSGDDIDACFSAICSRREYSIHILSLPSSGADVIAGIDPDHEKYPAVEKLSEQFPVAKLLSNIAPTAIFINKETEQLICFVAGYSERWSRAFCSTLFRSFIFAYPTTEDVSDEEKEFFVALHKDDMDTIKRITDSLCVKYNFEDLYIKKFLTGWNQKNINNTIEQALSNYESYMERARQKYDEGDGYMQEAARYRDQYTALTSVSHDEADDSVYNFFKQRPQIKITDIDSSGSGRIKFSVIETLEYYDEDEFKAAFENKDSFFYRSDISEQTRRALYAIFMERRGKIRTESLFALNGVSTITPIRGTSGRYDDTVVPHPHIGLYACLGGNERYVRQYLEKGDWEMAIDQCIATAKNIYFGDGVVMPSFFKRFGREYKDIKFIVADNGDSMTVKEFAAYIAKQNKAKEKGEK